jgi:preprotein translocase subunit SecB
MATQQSRKVTPEDFNVFLAGIDLASMRTVKIDVHSEREFQHKQVNDINVKFDATYLNNEEEAVFTVDVAYKVRLRKGKRVLGSLGVTFRLYFSSPEPLTDSLFAVFLQPVQFQTWPFLRQHLADVSARCNWPRLTLPLMHIQPDKQSSQTGPARDKNPRPKPGPKKKSNRRS